MHSHILHLHSHITSSPTPKTHRLRPQNTLTISNCWRYLHLGRRFLPEVSTIPTRGMAVPPTTTLVGRLRHFTSAAKTYAILDILDTNNNGQSKRSHSHTTMVMNHSKKQFRYILDNCCYLSWAASFFFTLCVMGTDEIVHVVRHNVLPILNCPLSVRDSTMDIIIRSDVGAVDVTVVGAGG
jgi:hypothetical protein